MMNDRPLLYLDVDGPLNPYAAKPERRPAGYTTHRMKPEGWLAQHPGEPRAYVKPLRVWLKPDHGRQLLELGAAFELVWATTWGAEANTFISPVLGLPELAVVDWKRVNGRAEAEIDSTAFREVASGTFWKTPQLVAYAAGRPFAWVDDELGDPDRSFVAAHHPARALLLRIDPRLGLLDTDFTALAEFGATFGAAAGGEG